MKPLHKTWTRELVIEKLKECKSRKEIKVKYSQGYRLAREWGIIDDYFPLKITPKPKINKNIYKFIK